MKLVAGADPWRIWIRDVETERDDANHVACNFTITRTGAHGMPSRIRDRLLAIAETMAEAANREHGG